MDQKESPGQRKRNDTLRIDPHYKVMTDKEAEEVIDILTSLILDYLTKEDEQ